MSVPASSRPAVVGARVADVQALLNNLAASLPKTQVLREIPFNSIQACQRAIAAGARDGQVVIDYARSEHGVPKLRIWDTGDGMGANDLYERLGSLSATARTDVNFGIGAKLALTRVSPHGVVYVSLREGHAHLVRWQYDPAHQMWGLAVVNPEGTDDRERTVLQVDPTLLPEQIQVAGHGTSVTILGQDASDDTTWSLRPDGSSSRRWVLEVLNDRFTQIPDGVEMRTVMPNVERDENGGLKDDVRTVSGSAGNLKYYTRDHANSSDPTTGARGKVRINGPVPATAYWWVLPAAASKPPSYMRIGGRVRVVQGGEVYETLGSKYMSTAGIWTQSTRVEIHFVPDECAGAQPDLQRTGLSVDGLPLPVLEWCEEFRRSMPVAIKNLLAGSTRTMASGDFTAQLTELCQRLTAAPVARRNGRRTNEALAPTGQFLPAGSPDPVDAAPARVRGISVLRGRIPGLGRPKRATDAPVAGTQMGELLTLDPAGNGRGRRVASAPVSIVLPDVTWVNVDSRDDDPELADLAGRFHPGENLLALNAQGATYRKLLASYVHAHRDVPGSRDKIQAQVRTYVELQMQDAIVGLKRDFPSSWQDMATPAALTVRCAGVYHVDTRLRQVFNRLFKGGSNQDVILDAAA